MEMKSTDLSQKFETLEEATSFAKELEKRYIPIESITKEIDEWIVKWSIAIHFTDFEMFLGFVDRWEKEIQETR